MDLKLRPFSERFDRGSKRPPLFVSGAIADDMFVIDVDQTRVPLPTHRIERDEKGLLAWVTADQELSLEAGGTLRVRAQWLEGEVVGAEITVLFGPEGAAASSGFTVFFNVGGHVDGQGTVRAVSEPPVMN